MLLYGDAVFLTPEYLLAVKLSKRRGKKMTEITLKEIGGLLISIIILSSGATIYLQETGKYKSCSGGWILMEDGKYECPTRDIDPQWCHHGSNEGPENIGYRCYLGLPVDISEPEPAPPITDFAGKIFISANAGSYECPTDNGVINSYTKCTKDDGKQTYLGELI